jgi:hypothetical protein
MEIRLGTNMERMKSKGRKGENTGTNYFFSVTLVIISFTKYDFSCIEASPAGNKL